MREKWHVSSKREGAYKIVPMPIVNILSTTFPLGAQKRKKKKHKHKHKPSKPSKKQDDYYSGLLS
jgi:hypothetical protein